MADGLHVRLRQAVPIPLDVEFLCAPDEMLALVGPSGSGKSTILRSIAGLYTPQRGHVEIGGETWLDTDAMINLPPHRRRAGLVFQTYALFPHMSALRNVMMALGHIPGGARESRARELLALTHLEGLESRKPAELSGGQQQRVAVARALARDPAVLLLDEPFSAVDRPTRRRLYQELQDLRASVRIPMILVTHDLQEASVLSNRIAVLDQGRILQTAAPRELAANPASERVAEILDLDV